MATYENFFQFNMEFGMMVATEDLPLYKTSEIINSTTTLLEKSELLKDPAVFQLTNTIDNYQSHNINNDSSSMIPHQQIADQFMSSTSPFWSPPAKTNSQQTVPNEYESWTKIQEGVTTKKSALRRKKSLLSTVGYEPEKEDDLSSSSSNGGSEDDEIITPPTTSKVELNIRTKDAEKQDLIDAALAECDHHPSAEKVSILFQQQYHQKIVQQQQLDKRRPTSAKANNDENSLCDIKLKQKKYTVPLHKNTEEAAAHYQQKLSIDNQTNPDIVSRHQSNSADQQSKDKQKKGKSWFGGLFGDKSKKTTNKKLTKKASLSSVIFAKAFNNTNQKTTISDASLLSDQRHYTSNNIKKRHSISYFSRMPSLSSLSSTSTISTMMSNNSNEDRHNKEGYGNKRRTSSSLAAAAAATPIINTRYTPSKERSLYLLSNRKLASPKRPLHQQVLISNLMHWYLSITTRKKQNQQTYVQKQPHPEQRQQINKNTNFSSQKGINDYAYQATYHSFEPPAPGGAADAFYISTHSSSSSSSTTNNRSYLSSSSSLSSSPPIPNRRHSLNVLENISLVAKYRKKGDKRYQLVAPNTQYASPVV